MAVLSMGSCTGRSIYIHRNSTYLGYYVVCIYIDSGEIFSVLDDWQWYGGQYWNHCLWKSVTAHSTCEHREIWGEGCSGNVWGGGGQFTKLCCGDRNLLWHAHSLSPYPAGMSPPLLDVASREGRREMEREISLSLSLSFTLHLTLTHSLTHLPHTPNTSSILDGGNNRTGNEL